MAKMVALVVLPLSQNKYLHELQDRMKSYYNFIERAAKNVGVTTSSRWKSFNYRYGFGGGYRNGNDNGNGNGNGGDHSNGNGNGTAPLPLSITAAPPPVKAEPTAVWPD